MTYTITNDEDRKTGKWMHYVTDADGDTKRYADDRTIDAACDSHPIAYRAAMELGLPEPDWIDHDGEFIHFGYKVADQAVEEAE